MHRRVTPETGQARSSHSSDLPHVKQEMADSDEEEKKAKITLADLQRQLKESNARNAKLQKDFDESQASAMQWWEKSTEDDTKRLAAEEQLREKTEECRLKSEELERITRQDGELYRELHAKWQNSNANSMELARRASEEMNAAALLRKEVEETRKELTQWLDRGRTAEASLAEARVILNGLTSQTEIKLEGRKPLTGNEIAAMQWRYPQLLKKCEQLQAEVEGSKVNTGLLECQRDELKLKLERVHQGQQGPADSEKTKEIAQKLADLEKGNAELREEHAQLMAKADKGSKEAQLVIGKLQADNEDLQDRLNKLAERQERNSDVLPNNNQFINRLTGEKKDLEDRLQKLADRLDRQKQNCRCDGHRDDRRHSGKHDAHSPMRDRSRNSESDETVKRLEKALAEANRAKGVMEKERNDARALLKTKAITESILQEDAEPHRDRPSDSVSDELKEKLKMLHKAVDDATRSNRLLEQDRDDLRASLKRKSDEFAEARQQWEKHAEQKRERSRNSESDELKNLKETVKRLERAVEDAKRANELLEQDRDELRAHLKTKREEHAAEKKKANEKMFLLQSDLDMARTQIFVLNSAKDEIKGRLEKEEQKTKELPEMQEQVKMLTNKLVEMEDEQKQLTVKYEREKKQLQDELEEKNQMNMFLVATTAGKLNEQLKEATEKIKLLESKCEILSELEKSQVGCSSAKRPRFEEVRKEPPPPPPFVLAASAAAPTAKAKKWINRFQPLQPAKAPMGHGSGTGQR